MPSYVLPLCLKQTFPPMIGIFTEGKGDEIGSRLPFKISATLLKTRFQLQYKKAKHCWALSTEIVSELFLVVRPLRLESFSVLILIVLQ